jgi:hypothetical protein
MAIKIENFDDFEVGGKTYVGNFPLYTSDIVCSITSAVDEEQNNLLLTSEGDFVNVYVPPPPEPPPPTPNWSGFLPLASTICVGVSFTQINTDLNGNYPPVIQTNIGTKQPTWTDYSPDASTIPLGQSFEQTRTNDCGGSQTITSTGTKVSEFFEYNIIISSNVNNYNGILSTLTSNGWDGIKKVKLTLTVNSGVTVGSNTTATAALIIPVMPANSLVILINNGNIYGAGGAAGVGGSGNVGNAGQDGGIALSISTPTTISNYGNIKGGGGGGGGGAGYIESVQCNCVNTEQKSAICCQCSYGCTAPKPGYAYHRCLQNKNCYYCGCAWGDCWKSECYSYNIITTCQTCNTTKIGGIGGIGQGSGNVAGSGSSGTSGKLGGAGGAFGNNGSSGENYNAILGGTGGLAGYYIKLSTGGTYAFATGLTGNVAGRIG